MIKKTNEQFLREINNRPFIALEEYSGAHVNIMFKCSVDGNEWSARPSNILSGRGCPICGAIMTGKKQIGENAIIEDNGDWLLVDISTKKFPSATMAIDKIFFITHKTHRIFPKLSSHKRQIYAMFNTGTGRTNSVHSLVMGRHSGMEIDHINHPTTNFIDNRASNLRLVTKSQNAMNRGLQANNTSGISGVQWHKTTNKWLASITSNHRSIHLGVYDDINLAIIARKEAEVLYFGDYAFCALKKTKGA